MNLLMLQSWFDEMNSLVHQSMVLYILLRRICVHPFVFNAYGSRCFRFEGRLSRVHFDALCRNPPAMQISHANLKVWTRGSCKTTHDFSRANPEVAKQNAASVFDEPGTPCGADA
jgi:hypothetical protein